MIPEMYETNKRHGLVPDEAAKLEMATSLAMLSSGANTTFWLTCQIFSNPLALQDIRRELMSISREDTTSNSLPRRIVNLAHAKAQCPTLMAILHETLRYHSSVINIKQVQHETKLAGQYLMKKGAIVMIPGQSVHHDKEIWGAQADVFRHQEAFSQYLGFPSVWCRSHHVSWQAFLNECNPQFGVYDRVAVQHHAGRRALEDANKTERRYLECDAKARLGHRCQLFEDVTGEGSQMGICVG
jgi:hypothetical protein